MDFIKMLLIYISTTIFICLIIIACIHIIKYIWKFLNVLEIKLANKIINTISFSSSQYTIIFIIWLNSIILKIAIPYLFILVIIKALILFVHSLIK